MYIYMGCFVEDGGGWRFGSVQHDMRVYVCIYIQSIDCVERMCTILLVLYRNIFLSKF